MNTWPWTKYEKNQLEIERINEELENIKEQIRDHFNSSILESKWLDNFLTKDFLLLGGLKHILKYAKCECCSYYVGPNPIKRKIYNISVLNAYCEKHYGKVSPTFVCNSIEFQPLWKQILEHKANQLGEYNFPPSHMMITLGLDEPINKYKKTHTRIPELWEYQ
jgi:hypothetical protein